MGIAQFYQQHAYIATVITTWLFNMIITAMISNMAAPTKDSSSGYVYWFKVLNTIMGNITRAQKSAVENSPNWSAAVTKVVNGGGSGVNLPPIPKQ